MVINGFMKMKYKVMICLIQESEIKDNRFLETHKFLESARRGAVISRQRATFAWRMAESNISHFEFRELFGIGIFQL